MGAPGRDSARGLKRRASFLLGFRYAFAGLWFVVRTQRNARVHLSVAGAVTLLGLWLGLPTDQWAVLVLTYSLVFSLEAVNSAVESLGDAISLEFHPLIGHAKDAAAAAVLLAAIGSVAVGLLILGPPLWRHLMAGHIT